MSKGKSGRIVVELDPVLKRRLYSSLAIDNKTLKDWMIECIENYLSETADSNSAKEVKT